MRSHVISMEHGLSMGWHVPIPSMLAIEIRLKNENFNNCLRRGIPEVILHQHSCECESGDVQKGNEVLIPKVNCMLIRIDVTKIN